MAGIDAENIAQQMITAAQAVLGEKWPEAKIFVESESRKFARNMAEIALWRSTAEITEEQAEVLSRLHQRSMKMVLTSLEGISLAMAEKAINSAIDVVRIAINSAIGWKVL
jgi:predicted Fe-S protein YdhL (DUF1289 family)